MDYCTWNCVTCARCNGKRCTVCTRDLITKQVAFSAEEQRTYKNALERASLETGIDLNTLLTAESNLKGIPAENQKTIENTGVLGHENLIGHFKSRRTSWMMTTKKTFPAF